MRALVLGGGKVFRTRSRRGDSSLMACRTFLVNEWWRSPVGSFFRSGTALNAAAVSSPRPALLRLRRGTQVSSKASLSAESTSMRSLRY